MDLINTIRNIGFGALIAGGISGSSVSLAEERLCYELLDGTRICTQDLVGSPGVAPDAQVAYPAPTAINSHQGGPSSPRGKVLEAEHKIASPSILPLLSSPTPEASPKVSPAKIVKRQPSPLERVVAAYTPEIKEYRGIVERALGQPGVSIFNRVMSSISERGKRPLDADERDCVAIFLTHVASIGEVERLQAAELMVGAMGCPVASSGNISLLGERIAPAQTTYHWDKVLKKFGSDAVGAYSILTTIYSNNPVASWAIARKMAELSKYKSWEELEAGFVDFAEQEVAQALDHYKSTDWPLYRTVLDTLLSTAVTVSSASAAPPPDENSSTGPAVLTVANSLSSYKKQGNNTRAVVDSLSTIASAPYSPRGFKDAPMKVKAIYDAAFCLKREVEKPDAGIFARRLQKAMEQNDYTSFFDELYARCPKKENAQKGSRPEIK